MTSGLPLNDPLLHPAFLDPRQWGEINPYASMIKVDRDPVPGDPHHAPDKGFRIQHIKLDLEIDFDACSISGKAVLTISPFADAIATIELDAAEMGIAAVRRLQHGHAAPADSPLIPLSSVARPLHYIIDRERLIIELDQKLKAQDTATIEIEYSCSPRKGLYFLRPDQAYPKRPDQVWSQGQTEDAHWWFPCADTPHQKMTTELIATVDSRFEVLSNGFLESRTENTATGKTTFHWKQEQPHPAYLVTLVAGDYVVLESHLHGLPVNYYVYPDMIEEGRRLFSRTPQMIEFFASRFGYPYPFAKYSQVLVHDFLFGAMENTSATTMTDRCLLDTRAELDITYEDIVAHELAHHWFGDLVTCKHWSEIWLNESFATYSEYLWREHTLGEDLARFVIFQDFLTYLNEDLTSHRRAIVSNRYRYSEELMDRHAYEKGGCVLHMLRGLIGDEAFFKTITRYLSKCAFGVGETSDLRSALEEVTGKNLYWFFDQWVYRPGYPELEVSYDYQPENRTVHLSVKQVQKNKGEDVAPAFRFPIEIEIVSGEGDQILDTERRASYHVWVDKEEQEFYFPSESRPRMVAFDKGNKIFKLMAFPKSWHELAFQIRHDHDYFGRMRAARDLVTYRTKETRALLTEVLTGTDIPQVRAAAAVSLGELEDVSTREALRRAYSETTDPQVRRACILALGNSREDVSLTIAFVKDALANDQSWFVGVAAMHALANLARDEHEEAAFAAICEALPTESWQSVITNAGLAAFKHSKLKRAVDIALQYTAYGQPVGVRASAIACLGAIGKELAPEKADGAIVDQLIKLVDDPAIRVQVASVRALGRIRNPRALPALEAARRTACLDQLNAALEDAIDGINKK